MNTTTKVLAFGEALIDFLSDAPDRSGGPLSFTRYPGGAPANVAVAVARLGGNSHFTGQVGDDTFGHFLRNSLVDYGVNTDAMLMTDKAKTALAFVSLDAGGERSFEFYRNATADVLFLAEDFDPVWFAEPSGVFHTCSNTLTDTAISQATLAGVSMARRAGWVVSADINLRTNLWPQGRVDKARVIDWMLHADVVKASLEELAELVDDPLQLIRQSLQQGVSLFVLTDGGNPVRYCHVSGEGEVASPKVTVRDTTAAGDAFVGGLLYQLARQAGNAGGIKALDHSRLRRIIAFSVACGACAVTRLGAYPSLPNQEEAERMLTGM